MPWTEGVLAELLNDPPPDSHQATSARTASSMCGTSKPARCQPPSIYIVPLPLRRDRPRYIHTTTFDVTFPEGMTPSVPAEVAMNHPAAASIARPLTTCGCAGYGLTSCGIGRMKLHPVFLAVVSRLTQPLAAHSEAER